MDWSTCLSHETTSPIVDHNPVFHIFCNRMMTDTTIKKLPTCAYARLELAADAWSRIGPGKIKLTAFLPPKNVSIMETSQDKDQDSDRERDGKPAHTPTNLPGIYFIFSGSFCQIYRIKAWDQNEGIARHRHLSTVPPRPGQPLS